ncbi:MAG TPA: hypothetical protein VFI72_18175, partial [Candidatus Angelobacter sp.]|nr:hypothetical protein [Candidatus Angelobacter sp.]
LEGIAWGAFFIWIGIAFLLHLDWGAGLLGVGVLMIGKQIARKFMTLPVETFWMGIAILFILCGIWGVLNVSVSLIPIVCILAGVALVISAFFSKPIEQKVHQAR